MTHTCVGNITIIGSDNSLSPGRRQAIIKPMLEYCQTSMKFQSEFKHFHSRKCTSSAKWRPFSLGLNVFMYNRSWILQTIKHPRRQIRIPSIMAQIFISLTFTIFYRYNTVKFLHEAIVAKASAQPIYFLTKKAT